jgi:hypothetical protein
VQLLSAPDVQRRNFIKALEQKPVSPLHTCHEKQDPHTHE